MEYYSYRMMWRKNSFNILHRSLRLFQVWTVDMYAKILQWRVNHARNHQDQLRADLYKGLEDQIGAADADPNYKFVGKKIILPATYSYTPRWYDRKYRDAMAIVAKYTKPDVFITFTCNAKWPEITDNLEHGQKAVDRPDLTARVFYMKFSELMKDLTQRHVLGPVVAWMHTIEYQKRGLPHAHILLIFDSKSKLKDASKFDEIVVAELPNKETHPELYDLVMKFMVHAPCENRCDTSCKKNGHRCSAHFPKEFSMYTTSSEDGYPTYQRRPPDNGGFTGKKNMKVGNDTKKIWYPIDNRYIVPYNPNLLKKYKAHINVEICCSIKAIKYLYKYIYKGHDKACYTFKINGVKEIDRDEITRYFDAFYLSGAEACWKMFGFPMHSRCPSVQICKFHLPKEQYICYKPDSDLQKVLDDENNKITMLTEWFETNKREKAQPLSIKRLGKDIHGKPHPRAKELLFHEFPEHYSWHGERNNKHWKRRSRNDKVIGRMHRLSPKCGEQYYLRLLLLNVRGATGWDDLLTVNEIKYDKFKKAAAALGLLKDDQEWHRCMQDAAKWKIGDQLLHLFVTILLNCEVSDPKKLWNEQKVNMSDDIRRAMENSMLNPDIVLTDEDVQNETLYRIQEILKAHKKTLEEFGLPPVGQRCSYITENNHINFELQSYNPREQEQFANNSYQSMNEEQKEIYTNIIDAIYENNGPSQHQVFFVDALGGTGKTFVAKAILAKVRSQKDIAIAVAFSGIAALLLPGGRTLHSRFNLPCDFSETTYADIRRGSPLAHLIEQAKVIIWDEAPMAHRHVMECLDRTFRDILENEQPFGGKKLVLSGDFRQVLPVIPRAARPEVVNACLNTSHLWPMIKVYHLRINERVKRSQATETEKQQLLDFANTLEEIGDGKYPICKELGPDMIRIPTDWLSKSKTIDDFINEAFPNFQHECTNNDYLRGRAILTPLNKHVLTINNEILKKLPTKEEPPIVSIDENIPDTRFKYGEEDFNVLNPSSLPPHKLYLRKNAVIMILRNLNPAQGACNGTRLKVLDFTDRCIKAVILTGPKQNEIMFIPRIRLYADKTSPIPFIRHQFPVKLAFAMTINKAQGQTLDFMALYLPEPVFSHGQFYVACGRVGSKRNLSIYVMNGKGQGFFDGYEGIYTRNVVYKEVFNNDYAIELEMNNDESTEDESTEDESTDNESTQDDDIDMPTNSESSDDDIDMQSNSGSSNEQYNDDSSRSIDSIHSVIHNPRKMTPEQRRQRAYDKSEMSD